MFYFLSFLDRANVGNAKVSGLMQDLGLDNQQYQVLGSNDFGPRSIDPGLTPGSHYCHLCSIHRYEVRIG
jgi:hypothetical protein